MKPKVVLFWIGLESNQITKLTGTQKGTQHSECNQFQRVIAAAGSLALLFKNDAIYMVPGGIM